ncbi:hypothetical protein BUALT_BualtUnG0040800 [Buddleja alternifolia]|uniref:Uncharacterized protein n=1 Tax=Buddleja alternifolia TaxID=168488 RepID=A0AAV6W372_9LAMI|nr:hypothetical protein BUALT_BualtUnG0040800 [Buddleja alternifolia]
MRALRVEKKTSHPHQLANQTQAPPRADSSFCSSAYGVLAAVSSCCSPPKGRVEEGRGFSNAEKDPMNSKELNEEPYEVKISWGSLERHTSAPLVDATQSAPTAREYQPVGVGSAPKALFALGVVRPSSNFVSLPCGGLSGVYGRSYQSRDEENFRSSTKKGLSCVSERNGPFIDGRTTGIEPARGGFTIHCLDPLGYIRPYPHTGERKLQEVEASWQSFKERGWAVHFIDLTSLYLRLKIGAGRTVKAHLVDSERAASTYSYQNEKQQAELEEALFYKPFYNSLLREARRAFFACLSASPFYS